MGHDSQQPWGRGRKAAPNLLAPTPSGAVEAQPVPGLWVSAWLLSPNSYSITSAAGSGFCSPCCLLHSSWQCRAGTCSASQPCLCSPSAAVRVATLSRKGTGMSQWVSCREPASQHQQERAAGSAGLLPLGLHVLREVPSLQGRWGSEPKLHFGLVPSGPYTLVTAVIFGHCHFLFFFFFSGAVGCCPWSVAQALGCFGWCLGCYTSLPDQSLSWTFHRVRV